MKKGWPILIVNPGNAKLHSSSSERSLQLKNMAGYPSFIHSIVSVLVFFQNIEWYGILLLNIFDDFQCLG